MISDLKGEALDSLEGKWGLAVGATLLISILITAFSFSVDWGFSLIFGWQKTNGSLSTNILSFFCYWTVNFRWILPWFKYPS